MSVEDGRGGGGSVREFLKVGGGEGFRGGTGRDQSGEGRGEGEVGGRKKGGGGGGVGDGCDKDGAHKNQAITPQAPSSFHKLRYCTVAC